METYRFFIVFFISVPSAFVKCGGLKNYYDIPIQYSLCHTDQCLNTASEIEARLNRTVDPCDDFYTFACGGWLQKTQLNRPNSYVSIFTEISEQTKKQLRELLEEPVDINDTKSLRKAKQIYAQCLTKDSSYAKENTNYIAILLKYTGWPILMHQDRSWDKVSLSLQQITIALHEMGFDNGFFGIQVISNIRDFNSNIILITDPTFFYSRDIMVLLNKNETEKKYMYISFITKIASHLIKELGGTVDMEILTRHAEEIINFEVELAKLTMPYEDYAEPDKVYNLITIQQFQVEYDKQHPSDKGKINWLEIIQNVFASEKIAIGPSEKLVVQPFNYLTSVVSLLERTPSRIILNYMIWSSIHWFYFHSIETSVDDTWCINQFNLKFAILHEYVKKYVSLDSINKITEILANIENTLTKRVKDTAWIDESKKKKIFEKLQYTRHRFVTPDVFNSDEAIDKYYENVDVGSNYLDTVINVFLFEKKKMMRSLRTPDSIFEQNVDLTSVQDYYNPGVHKIVVPATILRTPLFDGNRLPFLNYGSFGVFIGQYFYSAFSDNDVKITKKDSRSVILSSLSRLPINESEIMQCFIDLQMSKCPFWGKKLEHININEIEAGRKFKENIIDLITVTIAYNAFKYRTERLNDFEWRLRGLEQYSNDQMFFITYAQTMCENIPPEQLKWRMKNFRSLNKIRIRDSLSYIPKFSEAYNCSAEKPMNQNEKN